MNTEQGIMSVKNNKKKNWIIPAAVLLVFVLWSLWFWVPVTETIRLDPPDGSDQKVRIALVTDLHSCWYGKDQKDLIDRIEKEETDFVLLGGDIFDDVLKDERAETVIRQLVPKYPCYYVTGNHEYWSERVDEMKAYLSDAGVHVLAGDCETLTVKGRSFDICGVDDPTRMMEADWQDQLKQAWEQTNEDHVKILVSHRPELIEEYGKYDFDLVVTGHAHAGQFRIPFVNIGLYAPNQGAFPRYVSGTYPLENGGTMVVSRGLARESTPAPRYFNHPELVMIEM